jgi:hypothetical protein
VWSRKRDTQTSRDPLKEWDITRRSVSIEVRPFDEIKKAYRKAGHDNATLTAAGDPEAIQGDQSGARDAVRP